MINLGISGKYDFILNEGTDKERVYEDVGNAILDNFLVRLQTYSWGGNSFNNVGKYMRIGGSTTPVSYSQVALVNPLSSKNIQTADNVYIPVTTNGTTWTCGMTVVAKYNIGEFVGTINEVGMGLSTDASLGGLIHTRAVLSAPLVIAAEDQLTVKYTMTISCSDLDVQSQIVLKGVTHDVLARRCYPSAVAPFSRLVEQNDSMTAFMNNPTFGAKGFDPTGGTSVTKSGLGQDGLVSGQRRVKLSLATTEANHATGISCIKWSEVYKFQFTPPIPKTASSKLDLTFGYTFSRA